MMKDHDRAELERELRALLSSDFSRISVGQEVGEDGIQMVYITPTRLLTHDKVAAYCQDMASIICKRGPEKPDGWAAGIIVARVFGDPMGVYFLGWANQPDQWKFSEPPTDHAEWQALYQQLSHLLSEHDFEELGEGNFFWTTRTTVWPGID